MCSILKSITVAALSGTVVLAGLTGCQRKYAHTPTMTANDQIEPDDAMQQRQWDKEDAIFANSTTHAYKDRFPLGFQNLPETPHREGALIDAPLFVAQSVLLPFTLFVYPPGTRQGYRSLDVEPTYTAMPGRPPLDPIDSRGPVRGSIVPEGNAPPEVKPVPEGAPNGTPEDKVSPATGPSGV